MSRTCQDGAAVWDVAAAMGGQFAPAAEAAQAAQVPGALDGERVSAAADSRLSAKWGLFGFCQMDPWRFLLSP